MTTVAADVGGPAPAADAYVPDSTGHGARDRDDRGTAGGGGRRAGRAPGSSLSLGSSDLGMFQKDAADPTTSVLPMSLISQLRATPGDRDRDAVDPAGRGRQEAPGAIVFGAEPHSFVTNRYVFTGGQCSAAPSQVVDRRARWRRSCTCSTGGTLTVAHRHLHDRRHLPHRASPSRTTAPLFRSPPPRRSRQVR